MHALIYKCIENDSSRRSSLKWSPRFETSNFQGVIKYLKLERLRNIEETRICLLILFKETEDQGDYFKGLLKDPKNDRHHLKQKVILANENYRVVKIILYGLLLVVAFWKFITGME